MRDRDYYPAGAYDDPSAPYNEVNIPYKDFEISYSQSLSKSVIVATDKYIPGACGADYEADEDGVHAFGWHDDDDLSEVNWTEEYRDNDHYTPLQLIELFKNYLEEQKAKGLVFKTPKFTDHLIEECSDWVEDEIDYCY